MVSLAQQLPGPYAGFLLAEMGAEVILVEQLNGGDPLRGRPGAFRQLCAGTRSLAVDLKHPLSREVFGRLAETARVFLEGFRPGVARRLGVDYDTVRGYRPDAVYCSISGYGQDGVDAGTPGHDLSFQVRAGAPGHPSSLPISDLAAAMYATTFVAASLAGGPQSRYLDLSIADSMLSLLAVDHASSYSGDPPYDPGGFPSYGVFATLDGEVSLSVLHEDHLWDRTVEALGLAQLAGIDARRRLDGVVEFRSHLARRLSELTTKQALVRLRASGSAVGSVNDAHSVAHDDLFRSRGAVTEAAEGRRIHSPLRSFSRPAWLTAPEHGGDTRRILQELGYAESRVEELLDCGVVRSNDS